ncbi:MAG TPA: hypothetical protein VJO35_18735 [Terriglobales bacterium]|nr:hypothetical protein [Terriglobales bacterium]
MASFEGIRSALPAQLSSRSRKLRFYQSLFLWNESIENLIANLRGIEKLQFASKDLLERVHAVIEEVRCDINADFLEEQVEYELHDSGLFSKQRRAYDKEREDPDDIYFQVEEREEERKKHGLPPRIGILPYSAVADEEKRLEEQQERKERHRKKHSKPAANAKSTVREKGHD